MEEGLVKQSYFYIFGSNLFLKPYAGSMKKNILVIKNEYLPFSEGFIFDELSNLSKVKPIVWANRLSNINIFSLPPESFCLPWVRNKNTEELVGVLTKIKPDLIYFEFGYDAYQFLSKGIMPVGIPCVVALRGSDVSLCVDTHGYNYSNLVKYVDFFLTRSEEMLKRCIHLGIPKEKLLTHHSGIDIHRFPLAKIRKKNRGNLLFCGRFVEKKGLNILLRSIKIVQEKTSRKFKLTVVGEGKLLNEYMQLVKSLDITNLVDFIGKLPRNEIPNILLTTDTLIQPSLKASNGDMEGIPVVLMEALAMGIRVIGTKHAGIPEILGEGVGKLVQPKNVEELAKAILECLESPEIYRAERKRGRKKVVENFNIETQSRVLDDIFSNLIDRRLS